MSEPAPRTGTGIFWAAVLAFAVADLALAGTPYVARLVPVRGAAAVMAYVLLGAFALATAYASGVVIAAVRARSAPPRGDAVRACVVVALMAIHAVLLVTAARR